MHIPASGVSEAPRRRAGALPHAPPRVPSRAMADVEPAVEPPAAPAEAVSVPEAQSAPSAQPAAPRAPKRAPAPSAPGQQGIWLVRVPRPPLDDSSSAAGDEASKRLATADAKLTAAVAALAAAQARAPLWDGLPYARAAGVRSVPRSGRATHGAHAPRVSCNRTPRSAASPARAARRD